MSTKVYPAVQRLADAWEDIFSSAVCSGIRGDAAHARRGGYHISRRNNPHGNYSVIRPDDRAGQGPDDAAAAVDMTMNRRDMILCTKRMKKVWDNPRDPRRKYLNAFNGWLGSGAPVRMDMVARRWSKASPDHTFHCHGEIRRRWVRSNAMVTAWVSALRGESVATYLRGIGVKAPSAPAHTAPAKPPAKPAPAKAESGSPAKAPAAPAAPPPAKAPAVPKGPTPPPYPGRVLRRNDHQKAPDPAVKTWQARMLARGWKSIGVADGMFGARTESVVRRYQQTCKVGADGVIGPSTWPLPWTRPLGS